MQDELQVLIGVDVSKAELVAAGVPDHKIVTVKNTPTAIRRWLSGLPAKCCIAMESTGAYHLRLALQAHALGHRVYVLDAKAVWFYAKVEGQRGKTDRLDAALIRTFLQEKLARLRPWEPGSQLHRDIDMLLRRRDKLTDHRTAVRATMEGLPGIGRDLLALDRSMQRLLSAIDAKVDSLASSDPELTAARTRLQSIPGIGPLCSTLLAVLFARVPFKNANAVVAFSGLDPRPCDSGEHRGRRHITKHGPPLLRKLLFMAGFADSRSRAFKATYAAMRSRGISTTAAFMALGRKLLRIAWAVWRTKLPFDASRYSCAAT